MDLSWNRTVLFPWSETEPDLNASSEARGRIGFGAVPSWICGPRNVPGARPSKATGWLPIITSLGYVTLGEETPHEIRFRFVGPPIGDAPTGTTPIVGERWQQVPFDADAADPRAFVYMVGIPVPVDENNGTPYQLDIETVGRADPSQIVISWQWGRGVDDVAFQSIQRIAAQLVHELDEVHLELAKLRGGDGG